MPDRTKELVNRYQRQVFTFASYFLGNREDAEEVTQDVLLAICRQDRAEDGDLGAWIHRVTRNACIDRLRQTSRRDRRIVSEDPVDISTNYPSSSSPPDDDAARSEFRTRLKKALLDLNEPSKSILILREIQEKSYREISEALDLSMDTVKISLYRGRRRLLHLLREFIEDDLDEPK